MPSSTPAAAATAATAAAATRITASGRPSDAQPILAATAGSGFGNYNGIYGTQVWSSVVQSYRFQNAKF